MLSRVAIVGNNGAGKSTMVKCLLGELMPTSGEVWKHPGARVAYVAQHAFAHLDENLKKSATQYILDRFAGNIDNESIAHRSQLGETTESQAAVKKMRLVDGKLVHCSSSSEEERTDFADEREKVLYDLERKLRQDKKKGLLREDERRRLEDRIAKMKARLEADAWG